MLSGVSNSSSRKASPVTAGDRKAASPVFLFIFYLVSFKEQSSSMNFAVLYSATQSVKGVFLYFFMGGDGVNTPMYSLVQYNYILVIFLVHI